MTDKPLPVAPVTDPRALAARVRLHGLNGKPLRQAAWKPLPAEPEPEPEPPKKWTWRDRIIYWWATGKWL